ncbi:hypothetical protein HDV00_002060 [Rhizophlyctis rosea]|nr:hypothetical protein HDV00_002060 [Rhizophlyctis rosea]
MDAKSDVRKAIIIDEDSLPTTASRRRELFPTLESSTSFLLKCAPRSNGTVRPGEGGSFPADRPDVYFSITVRRDEDLLSTHLPAIRFMMGSSGNEELTCWGDVHATDAALHFPTSDTSPMSFPEEWEACSISHHLESLWKDQQGAFITIKYGTEQRQCHKSILSRAPYFNGLFNNDVFAKVVLDFLCMTETVRVLAGSLQLNDCAVEVVTEALKLSTTCSSGRMLLQSVAKCVAENFGMLHQKGVFLEYLLAEKDVYCLLMEEVGKVLGKDGKG